jgi:hypothetical protein
MDTDEPRASDWHSIHTKAVVLAVFAGGSYSYYGTQVTIADDYDGIQLLNKKETWSFGAMVD